MKKVLLGAVAFIALATPASAADLEVRASLHRLPWHAIMRQEAHSATRWALVVRELSREWPLQGHRHWFAPCQRPPKWRGRRDILILALDQAFRTANRGTDVQNFGCWDGATAIPTFAERRQATGGGHFGSRVQALKRYLSVFDHALVDQRFLCVAPNGFSASIG